MQQGSILPASDSERSALARLLVDAVREAGMLALSMFQTPIRAWTKADTSPVCEADIAVDRFLRERLGSASVYKWLSEESAADPGRLSASRIWVVDPIDGTRAYIAGLPDWTVAAALVECGRPIIAAIFAPIEQRLFSAIAGEGARLNGETIRVTDATKLGGSRIAGPRTDVAKLAAALPAITTVPKIHSLALRFARIAEGTLDAALAGGRSHDWDFAAADLVVHEAGGMLTTRDGGVPTYNRAELAHPPLVAAGPLRHRALMDLINARNLLLA